MTNNKNKYIGSEFEQWLREELIYEDVVEAMRAQDLEEMKKLFEEEEEEEGGSHD